MVAKISFPASRNRGAIVLRKPNAVSIEKSWKTLTDMAEITLPRNVLDFEKEYVNEVFKKDDPVTIELGYNGTYHKEFEGFVSQVSADIPIKIKCEDLMAQIQKIPVHHSFRSTSLKNLFGTLAPKFEVDALEVELGALRFTKTNMGEVLKFLQDDYSLYSYIKQGVLVCGKVYSDDSDVETTNLHLEKNVVNNSLSYKNAEDILIRINAVSTLNNGAKLEVTVGDKDGEERQLSYYGIESTVELQKLAEEDLKKYKVNGFDGSIETFGVPVLEHGYKVQLLSDVYPDRNGTYYVERVKVDFNDSPKYRRIIELGDKVA